MAQRGLGWAVEVEPAREAGAARGRDHDPVARAHPHPADLALGGDGAEHGRARGGDPQGLLDGGREQRPVPRDPVELPAVGQ
jgi:hypothetical protein